MAASYDALKEEVEGDGGLLACSMDTLKGIHGAQRLGNHVVQAISNQLAQRGLGHIPRQLPTYQHEIIRIYRRGTPVGNVIEAVLEPTNERDDFLRQISNSESEALLQKIRELICG